MKKKKKMNKNKYYIGIAVLAFAILIGGAVSANVSFKDLVASKVADRVTDELLNEGEDVLGGSTSDDWNVGGNLSITGTSAFTGAVTLTAGPTIDGNITLTDGSNQTEYFYEVVDFTSTGTSTLALFDPNSEGYDDFYLVDLWIENSSKATSTSRIAVTTSTATVIASDDTTILTEDAGAATLMYGLGNAFGADGAAWNGATATSSEFYLRQYPGTDTRLGAGTNPYPILIASTTNIMVFSTSTEDGPVYMGGKLHIVGKESNR